MNNKKLYERNMRVLVDNIMRVRRLCLRYFTYVYGGQRYLHMQLIFPKSVIYVNVWDGYWKAMEFHCNPLWPMSHSSSGS